MAVGVQTFCGARLSEARLARGLYRKSLGDMLGISGTAITRYEEETDKPLRDRVTALSQHLGFPEAFFLKPIWHDTLEPVFWRSRSTETKHAREMTEQRMKWACEVFNFLENEVNFPKLDLPDLGLPSDFRLFTAAMIEGAAERLRELWNLRDRPIPDVILALENAGVPVVTLEIPSEKQDGFCFWSRTLGRPFVGINTSDISCARARYDAAHELGHLVLHKSVTAAQEKDPALKKLIEQQAFRFGGAFLFPQHAFLSEVRYPSLDYFCDLKKKWGMSIGAMVYRACNLGMIDDEEKSMLYQSMGRRGWRGPLREPFDYPKEMPLEQPRMLRRGVEAILQTNIYGWAAIQEGLGLPLRETEQIVGVSPGHFASAEVAAFPVTPRERSLKAVDLESGQILEFPKRRSS